MRGSKNLKNKNLRRLLAGASTAAIAVGFATSFGVMAASTASADPVSKSTTSGGWTFNRTISNGTPAHGEVITVTNNVHMNSGNAPIISAFKDIHPACLTYVGGSAKVNGSTVTASNSGTGVNMTGSWSLNTGKRDISYTLSYTVGTSCVLGAVQTTGAGLSSTLFLGTETADTGPSITAKIATVTTLVVAPAPQATSVSALTATVTAGATGNVEFSNNGTLLGTGTIANGVAAYAWTPVAADAGKPFSITAKYLSDALNATSTSVPQTGTVAAAPTAPAAPTALVVNPASVTIGGTVTVSGKAEAKSTVKVTAGDKTCTATADNAGAFSCDIVTSAAGPLTVTAAATNAIGTGPASAPVTFDVTKHASTTGLAVSPAPQSDAASTLTATVTAGATGTVEFSNNNTLLGTGTIANGTATYAWTPSAADAGQPFSLTAKYLGDATHAESTSAPQTGTVTAAPTAPAAPTDVVAAPASVVAGGAVTVSGKAEAGSSVTVSAGDMTCTATADAAGTFSCDIATSVAGTLTVTAVAANAVGVSAVSVPVSVTVTAVPTVPAAPTELVAAPASVVAGGAVTVSGKAEAGSSVTVSAGDVTCTATADAAGAFSCDIVTSVAGTLTVTAVAANAVGVGPVSSPVSVTVTAVPTVPAAPTDVVATPASVVAGGAVTVSGKAEANSTVTVSAGEETCTATADAAGAFSCDIVTSVAGTLTVTAVAANAVGVGPVSSPVSVTVTAVPTVPAAPTELVAAPASVVAGGAVTVSGKAEAGSTVTVSAGDKTCIATADAAGAFSCDIVTSVAGTLTVTAVAANAVGAGPVSAAVSVTVTAVPVVDSTSTTVLSVAGEAKVGVALDLSAAVAGQPSGEPVPSGGTVDFKVNGSKVGSAPVVNGAATYSHTFNTAGSATVTAVYSGLGTLAGSTSNDAPVNVTEVTPVEVETTTTLTVPASGVVGTAVQLKANVSPLGSVGTVQFFEGDVALGAAVDVKNGAAVANYNFTTTGKHSITAVFSGGPGLKTSTSAVSVIDISAVDDGNGGGNAGTGSLSGLGGLFGS
ncbi:beta strand repeat-containing protein [Rhodococcus sp. OK302]|uniref:beta strand repeat-containing protein n=1 Tax=Rhodococcus sp. OK302 TaxID=1882769 RepID=UPI00159619DE|nr:Ig-like domain repeat protein [Rhodococcus sp. OK302]